MWGLFRGMPFRGGRGRRTAVVSVAVLLYVLDATRFCCFLLLLELRTHTLGCKYEAALYSTVFSQRLINPGTFTHVFTNRKYIYIYIYMPLLRKPLFANTPCTQERSKRLVTKTKSTCFSLYPLNPFSSRVCYASAPLNNTEPKARAP